MRVVQHFVRLMLLPVGTQFLTVWKIVVITLGVGLGVYLLVTSDSETETAFGAISLAGSFAAVFVPSEGVFWSSILGPAGLFIPWMRNPYVRSHSKKKRMGKGPPTGNGSLKRSGGVERRKPDDNK